MPTEFYTTDDYSVVMILQQDVDTIHSAGTRICTQLVTYVTAKMM